MSFIVLVLFPCMVVTAAVAVMGFRRGARARPRALAWVCLGITVVLGACIRHSMNPESVYSSLDWWVTTLEFLVGIAIGTPSLIRIAFMKL